MRKVSLWLRVRIEGKQRYLPAMDKKHIVALLDGKAQRFETGSYHLRYEVEGRRVWERVSFKPKRKSRGERSVKPQFCPLLTARGTTGTSDSALAQIISRAPSSSP